ncbi:hypothetical protein ACWA2B_24870 [Paenibacillus sp. CMM36]
MAKSSTPSNELGSTISVLPHAFLKAFDCRRQPVLVLRLEGTGGHGM